MWSQIAAIWWAQLRITRNHLPRTSVGVVLLGLFGLVWYGIFVALAVTAAALLPQVPLSELQKWLPAGLLAMFAFWQLIPLFTLSGGWSLQLRQLLAYPIRHRTLFAIEVFLRVTTAPEMIIVLLGALIGLLRHPGVGLTAFALLLFIPLNLFLSLAIREVLLQAFARNKFREILTALIVCISIIPQILARTRAGKIVLPYILAAANGIGAPWREVAVLALGSHAPLFDFLLLCAWTALFGWFARVQFERGLHGGETIRAGASAVRKPSVLGALADIPNRLFRDPLAALLQKEYRSLLRMPRFRVMFGMACVFSVLVFIPMTLDVRHSDAFMSNNFLVIATLYGLLIMSDALLFNVFGFDRLATQIYFVTPIPFRSVLYAKNLTAVSFVAIQSFSVLIVASLMRIVVAPVNILNAVLAAAVVGTFFLSAGNITSIAMARPLNPSQTLRRNAGGKMQLWLLVSALGMFVLVGLGFLARWAADAEWAMPAVLAVELIIAYIVYRVATDSAVEKALAQRERLIDSLSKGAASVMGLGMS